MKALFPVLMLCAGLAAAAEPSLSAADTQLLRAQVLLDRAHFSPGEMDAAYGSNMQKAIRGFQKLRQLRVSGTLDAATWKELERDQAPVLEVYTLTAQDIAGPYVKVPSDMAGKA
ncbi:MAG TPA: peptidoglycan-binding domain-containing protein, partial [Duganella sp.]|nr:peptidoglycan-binding domain-containing protein [Duganella sp.]